MAFLCAQNMLWDQDFILQGCITVAFPVDTCVANLFNPAIGVAVEGIKAGAGAMGANIELGSIVLSLCVYLKTIGYEVCARYVGEKRKRADLNFGEKEFDNSLFVCASRTHRVIYASICLKILVYPDTLATSCPTPSRCLNSGRPAPRFPTNSRKQSG